MNFVFVSSVLGSNPDRTAYADASVAFIVPWNLRVDHNGPTSLLCLSFHRVIIIITSFVCSFVYFSVLMCNVYIYIVL
jgi:hypothetical protein